MARRTIQFLFILLTAVAAVDASEAEVKRSAKFEGPRKEPPSRDFDALHLRLECEFNWQERSVDGVVVHRLRCLRGGVRRVRFDGIGIDVGSVFLDDSKRLRVETLAESIEVELDRELRAGEEISLKIVYKAQPRRGLHFFSPSAMYPDRPKQIWTQGEAEEARHWIPCFDHPSDKLTTEMLVSVPADEDLQVISNGRLVKSASVRDGMRLFHWLQDRPHTTYLISVVVGKFAHWRDSGDGIEIGGYVAPHYAAHAERSFGLTRQMLDFFEQKLQYPYPWARYDQVCVHEFPFGGMENTTVTTLTERTLHDERAALDVTSMDLVAHELIHQWFGNLVTCKDWSQIWINESFATFFANVWREHHLGRDEGLHDRLDQAERYLREDRGEYRRRLVSRRYRSPSDLFDRHAYPKGARILHMLRYVLGEDEFYRGLSHFLKRNEFRSVETADVRIALEEATGQSLRWFFDQWMHGGGHPHYRIRKSWDRDEGTLQVRVEQVQKVDDLTPLFDMPVVLRIVTPSGTVDRRVRVAKAKETFTFPVAERPRMVRFDPDDYILKEVDFERSLEELVYQLEHCDDMLGRLEAARELASFKRDTKAVAALLRALQGEAFWGVRRAIVRALAEAEVSRDSIAHALMTRFDSEEKAAVRRASVTALGAVLGEDDDAAIGSDEDDGSRDDVAAFLRRVVDDDASYYVVADAVSALGKLLKAGAQADAEAALSRSSHRDVIRVAAIGVLAAERDAESDEVREQRVETLAQLAKTGSSVPARVAALSGVATLGHGTEAAYESLVAALSDEVARVRAAAVEALAGFGDERAIEELQQLKKRETGNLFRDPIAAIDVAITRIRKADGDGDAKELEALRRRSAELEKRIKRLEESRS